MKSPPALGRVLVVDEDIDVLDLLDRQLLEPLGYEVATAGDATTALKQAMTFDPDVMVISLTLSGLSGKDLLVAIRSQGMELPTLVTSNEGMDADAIQAFRLGASDYLVKPLREAEVVSAVERAVQETRVRQEAERLAEELKETNRKLERRVSEMTTLFGIGKAVTSTTHQRQLFDKLMEGSLYVTDADMGWVLLQEEEGEQLLLHAQSNLPASLIKKMHKPWDDGVSSLVMRSAESLAIHGEGLSQFKLARLGTAALIVPIKVRDKPIGIIAVARKEGQPFSDRNQTMLEAVSDYASISLVNAGLFQVLEARARRLQSVMGASGSGTQIQESWRTEWIRGLRVAREQVVSMLKKPHDSWLVAGLETVSSELEGLLQHMDKTTIIETDTEES